MASVAVPLAGIEGDPLDSPVPGVHLRFVHINGVRLRIAEAGPAAGPLVLLLHGWPESWYSWRHQLLHLAQAGFRAVAPDLRGFGASDAPVRRQAFDAATLCADMVALLRDELQRTCCLLVGHDWGAMLAWHCCLLEPCRFVALCAMSVPPVYGGEASPIIGWARRFGVGDDAIFYYILYHNETTLAGGGPANLYGEEAASDTGLAEAEYDADVEVTLKRLYLAGTQSSVARLRRVGDDAVAVGPRRSDGGGAGFLPRLPPTPEDLPAWLSADDLAYVAAQYKRSGFRGGVNLYRNFGRNWRVTKRFAGTQLQQPVLFIAGEEDTVVRSFGGIEGTRQAVERKCHCLDGCIFLADTGHWCQQENAEEVSTLLVAFAQRHKGLLREQARSHL